MFEGSGVWILFDRARGIVKHRVADVAIVADRFAGVALVLAIVATETSRRLETGACYLLELPREGVAARYRALHVSESW